MRGHDTRLRQCPQTPRSTSRSRRAAIPKAKATIGVLLDQIGASISARAARRGAAARARVLSAAEAAGSVVRGLAGSPRRIGLRSGKGSVA